MTDDAIYAGLAEIFEDVFLRPVPLTPALTARDVEGWDSFRQIDIILAVQERFGFKATTREWDGLASVGDLASLIAAKTGGD